MATSRLSGSLRHLMSERSTITAASALSALVILAFLSRRTWSISQKSQNAIQEEKESLASAFDPPILKKHSKFTSYTTDIATYPNIRTFYHAHPQASKLPSNGAELPLLVFIHGLGGSLAQFAPLLASFINIAPCLGIDMPGCGLSSFEPKSYEAYTTDALSALHKTVIEKFCKERGHRNVVLIGHSMGCSISALLVSNAEDHVRRLSIDPIGMVAICPKSDPPTRSEATKYRRLFACPDVLLDGLRWLDKRGGTESKSVARFVGKDAGIDLKTLQLRFNSQFPTAVWKRKALGALPSYTDETEGKGGLPGRKIWAGIATPLMLIAGAADTVTSPGEVSRIVSYLQGKETNSIPSSKASRPTLVLVEDLTITKALVNSRHRATSDDTRFAVEPHTSEDQSHHCTVVKTAIIPAPASHALLYDHSTYRTCAGLIEDFLSTHVSPQLNLGWQLQNLTTSGKWDVKNLAKWKSVAPVSGPIDHGRFRALKTLREQDEEHTPSVFLQKWREKIFAVIDISHDSPIYDTTALDKGGIQYHKFPTVSKVPPTVTEVQDFIKLVERLRKEMHEQAASQKTENAAEADKKAVAVHCHYGYNRTGFFIACYLVEKRGYTVQEAIDEFATQRPPGIRHDHFIDTLFVRYCVGLKKGSSANGIES